MNIATVINYPPLLHFHLQGVWETELLLHRVFHGRAQALLQQDLEQVRGKCREQSEHNRKYDTIRYGILRIQFCQTAKTIIPASLETGQYLTITRNLDISFPPFRPFSPFPLQNPVPVQTIVSTKVKSY